MFNKKVPLLQDLLAFNMGCMETFLAKMKWIRHTRKLYIMLISATYLIQEKHEVYLSDNVIDHVNYRWKVFLFMQKFVARI